MPDLTTRIAPAPSPAFVLMAEFAGLGVMTAGPVWTFAQLPEWFCFLFEFTAAAGDPAAEILMRVQARYNPVAPQWGDSFNSLLWTVATLPPLPMQELYQANTRSLVGGRGALIPRGLLDVTSGSGFTKTLLMGPNALELRAQLVPTGPAGVFSGRVFMQTAGRAGIFRRRAGWKGIGDA